MSDSQFNVGTALNSSDIPREKKILRKAFPTPNTNVPQTPFRLVMNAGDPNIRQNSTATGAASGNQKFVYDSSDYIRFQKIKNKNRLYKSN